MLPTHADEAPRVTEERISDWHRFENDVSFSLHLAMHHLPGQSAAWRTEPTFH